MTQELQRSLSYDVTLGASDSTEFCHHTTSYLINCIEMKCNSKRDRTLRISISSDGPFLIHLKCVFFSWTITNYISTLLMAFSKCKGPACYFLTSKYLFSNYNSERGLYFETAWTNFFTCETILRMQPCKASRKQRKTKNVMACVRVLLLQFPRANWFLS